MIAEAIKRVQETTPVEVREFPSFIGDPPWIRRYYNTSDGKLHTVEVGVAPRRLEAFTLESFIEQVEVFDPDKKSAVWCGRGKVSAIFDEDQERRETLVWHLTKAASFVKLIELEDGLTLDQRDLIHTLRIDFAKRIVPDGFLQSIRTLKFKRDESGHADIKVGAESLGKSVLAEVVGAGSPLPDEIQIATRVYDQFDAEYLVRVAFDVDMTTQRFMLKTVAGETERCLETADKALHEALHADLVGVPVFMGQVLSAG